MVNETIPALLKLREEGLVRHIGITGLPLKIYPYVLDRCGGRFQSTPIIHQERSEHRFCAVGTPQHILTAQRTGSSDRQAESLIYAG